MKGDHGFDSEDEFRAEAEEAMVDGDRPLDVGPVRAALAIRDFRTMWLSTLGSTIGTWMQNVILAAFVYATTKSAWLVSLVGFCNLVPQLLFATFGGVIADMFDRKKLIIWLSLEQLLGSLAIAWIVRTTDFSRPALLVAVFAVGTGAALQGPVFLAVTPSLVPQRLLAGAISLNSVSMNVSRVVGPAIGAVLYVEIGASWVFVLNAATYLIIMGGVTLVRFPHIAKRHDESVLDRIFGGFRYVRRDPVVWRAIRSLFTFSVFCMPFVVLYPAIAAVDWGVSSKSTLYGFLYATFGTGAVVGALSVGTVLSRFRIETLLRVSFVLFGIALALYVTIRQPWMAFPIGFALGFWYFAVVTSLSTIFQSRLDHAIRGRVSAVWMMCFGGTVPVSGLLAGWVVSFTGVNPVVYFGAAFALFLAWWCDLRPPEERVERRTLLQPAT
jgi:MFS family permease